MRKENNNNIIYLTILLPKLPSSVILESTLERNQRCLHLVESVRMLNINNADYVDYILVLNPWSHMDLIQSFIFLYCF